MQLASSEWIVVSGQCNGDPCSHSRTALRMDFYVSLHVNIVERYSNIVEPATALIGIHLRMNPMLTERDEKGRQLVKEMLGDTMLKRIDDLITSKSFGSESARLCLGNAFADFWTRPGLERKYRSMITMAVLIALRTPEELKHHIKAAINNGCTLNEIEEVILHTIPYCGFPSASIALTAAFEVFKEHDHKET
jgi:4-carboxymuconolactone decarboxylase